MFSTKVQQDQLRKSEPIFMYQIYDVPDSKV